MNNDTKYQRLSESEIQLLMLEREDEREKQENAHRRKRTVRRTEMNDILYSQYDQ